MSQFLTPTFFCILLFSSSSVAQSQPLQLLAWPTVNAARTDVALGTNGKIAFVKYSANASNIFVMNADGTDQSNVTYGSSPVVAQWQPDSFRNMPAVRHFPDECRRQQSDAVQLHVG